MLVQHSDKNYALFQTLKDEKEKSLTNNKQREMQLPLERPST
jgi:hypothetical protein